MISGHLPASIRTELFDVGTAAIDGVEEERARFTYAIREVRISDCENMSRDWPRYMVVLACRSSYLPRLRVLTDTWVFRQHCGQCNQDGAIDVIRKTLLCSVVRPHSPR